MKRSDLSISVREVSKRFRVYHERPHSLKLLIAGRQRTRYEMFWALKDVSLDVQQGEAVGLIGPNGSGKSTLLRLVGRIYRPTLGDVETRGRVAALLELTAGFHPDLTGRDNVHLNGALLGMDRSDVRAVMDDIVSFAEVGDFLDVPIKLYSSGMQARLGFSVAVHSKPDVLLVDEALAVGDERFQLRCFERIRDLRNSGTTIVFVSHALRQVREVCDRVLWLDHGVVVAEGEPDRITEQYAEAARGDHKS